MMNDNLRELLTGLEHHLNLAVDEKHDFESEDIAFERYD
jgi:hypothetical protein